MARSVDSHFSDRQQRIKELTDKLEAGVAAVFESDKYVAYLSAMAKFHHYSYGNVMLILMQCPHASRVAGFSTWKKTFGRHVKRGEQGIQILAPCPSRQLVEMDKLDPITQAPILDANGEPEKELTFVARQSFRIAYVYDISQTEGRELPGLGVNELTGDLHEYEALFSAVQTLSPAPICFRPANTPAKGCYNHLEQRIYINKGMSQIQTLKTAIHETAHAKLHARPVVNGKAGEAPEESRRSKEVEAESIAYVVCQHFGIDTSEYSFPYVTSWSSGKETAELKASLDCISKTAEELIDGIERLCPELFPSSPAIQATKEYKPRKDAALR